MKIERLTLTNFRGVAYRSFNFHPEFNLIVGVNGVGKTSVLEALRVMLAHALQMFAKAPRFNTDFQVVDLMRGADELTAEMTFSCHGVGPYTYLIKKGEQSHINNPGGGLRDQTSETPDIRKLWHSSRPEAILSSGPPAFKSREDQPLGLHFSVSRARSSDERSKPGRSTNPGYFGAFVTDRGLRVQDLVDWLRNKDQIAREAPEGNSARQKAAVLSAITAMLPELTSWRLNDGRLWVSKQISRRRIDESSPSREVHVVSELMSLQVEELSDGERSLVVLGFDIARRLAQLNPNDPSATINGRGVVLIDELDIHLHPNWQRRIVGDLRRAFPALQFICSTHSPFLIQSLRSGEELIVLDGQPTSDLGHMPIEDIARGIMGVENTEVSEEYDDMRQVARQYLETLEEAAIAPEAKQQAFQLKLAEAIAPYAHNPAYQAFLEMKRAATLGE